MVLELQNIRYNYSHKTVLNELYAEFLPKKLYAITGENGAGKSTLANIICGELKPTQGTILIDGNLIEINSPKTAIQNKICYVHQFPLIADSLTVKENLMLGLSKEGISLLKGTLPFLQNINLNIPAKNLSSDQRVFVALQSALLKKPEVLILDEPTALLDNEQRNFLYEKLTELVRSGLTIIVITHYLEEAQKYCDETRKMCNGKLEKLDFPYNKEQPVQDKNLPTNDDAQTAVTSQSIEKKHSTTSCNSISSRMNQFQISYKNISFKQKDSVLLSNLSFEVKGGQITMITGLAEDGLLTLENIITGMDSKRATGELIITGDYKTKLPISKNLKNLKSTENIRSISISRLTPRLLREKLGFTTAIIPTDRIHRGSSPVLTLRQLTGNSSVKTETLINQAQINVISDEKASELSGGMLQRFILNRELSLNPQYLILCHPLQGLDPEATEFMCTKIRQVANTGCAILVLSAGEFPLSLCEKSYQLYRGSFV